MEERIDPLLATSRKSRSPGSAFSCYPGRRRSRSGGARFSEIARLTRQPIRRSTPARRRGSKRCYGRRRYYTAGGRDSAGSHARARRRGPRPAGAVGQSAATRTGAAPRALIQSAVPTFIAGVGSLLAAGRRCGNATTPAAAIGLVRRTRRHGLPASQPSARQRRRAPDASWPASRRAFWIDRSGRATLLVVFGAAASGRGAGGCRTTHLATIGMRLDQNDDAIEQQRARQRLCGPRLRHADPAGRELTVWGDLYLRENPGGRAATGNVSRPPVYRVA